MRGLDIQVARAMGWVYTDLGKFGLWDLTRIKIWKHPDSRARCYLPPYSTDMSAVWRVVDYARQKDLVLRLYEPVPGDCWDATFFMHSSVRESSESIGWWSRAPTAPRAICLAFLKAMEGKS